MYFPYVLVYFRPLNKLNLFKSERLFGRVCSSLGGNKWKKRKECRYTKKNDFLGKQSEKQVDFKAIHDECTHSFSFHQFIGQLDSDFRPDKLVYLKKNYWFFYGIFVFNLWARKLVSFARISCPLATQFSPCTFYENFWIASYHGAITFMKIIESIFVIFETLNIYRKFKRISAINLWANENLRFYPKHRENWKVWKIENCK